MLTNLRRGFKAIQGNYLFDQRNESDWEPLQDKDKLILLELSINLVVESWEYFVHLLLGTT